MLDEKFDREQTSSNIIQHNFFLLFCFFLNFESSQMYPTFHPTSKIFVGCICAGLYHLSIRHVAKEHHIAFIFCLQMHWAIFIITFYFVVKYFAPILAYWNLIYCPIVGNQSNFRKYWFGAKQSQKMQTFCFRESCSKSEICYM